jgi:hypothetical protein
MTVIRGRDTRAVIAGRCTIRAYTALKFPARPHVLAPIRGSGLRLDRLAFGSRALDDLAGEMAGNLLVVKELHPELPSTTGYRS